jgi:hypothetical protein
VYGVTRWHHQHENVTMEEVLGAPLFDPLEKIIEERTLKFIVKVAELPSDNVTTRQPHTPRCFLPSQSKPNPVKACGGRRSMHTKGRYYDVLCSNNCIESKKNPSHKIGSMYAWKPKLVDWKNGGSKLEKWRYHLNAPLLPTFDNLDLCPIPAQPFGLNPHAPLWHPTSRPFFCASRFKFNRQS